MPNPLPELPIDLPHEHAEGHPGLLWSIVNAYVLFVGVVTLLISLRKCIRRKKKDGTLFRDQKMHAFVLGSTLLSLIAFFSLVFYPGIELKKTVRDYLDQYAWANALFWLLLAVLYIRHKWRKIKARVENK